MNYDEFGYPIRTSYDMDPTVIYDAMGRKHHLGDTRLVDASTIDCNYLSALGFEPSEIQVFIDIISKFFMVNTRALYEYANMTGIYINQLESQRLQYAYKIVSGKEVIDTQSYKSVAAHARKMYKGTNIKLDFDRIGSRGKHEIPRTAVVDGLPQPFAIWNSRDYPQMERTYKVDKIAKEYVTIKTDRIPKLKYNDATEIPGVLKILSNENGIITVQIHKKYCRLCNRFVIIASRSNPDRRTILDTNDKFNGDYNIGNDEMLTNDDEYTHGCIVMVAADGTIIYLYAKTMRIDKYGNSVANISDTTSSRVLDYGFYNQEIVPKLRNIGKQLYNQINGIYMKEFTGSRTYQEITTSEVTATMEDIENDEFEQFDDEE